MDQTERKLLKFRYFQFCRIQKYWTKLFFGSQNVRNGPPKHFIASYCIFVSQNCNKLLRMMAIFCSSENHTKISVSVISVFTHFGWVQVGIENSIKSMLHPYMCYCIAHVAFAFRSGVEGFNFTFKKRWWHGALYLSSSDNLQCVVMFRNG